MRLIAFEAGLYAAVVLAWFLFHRFAHRNVLGGILAGSILGLFSEFSTEPLCDYFFKITLYRDIPLCIVLCWGVMYATAAYLSERLGAWALRPHGPRRYDKRVLLFDMLAGAVIGFPLETIGAHLRLWNYRYDLFQWNWGTVPFFGMPYEILVAYMLLMLTGPTFVRYWQGSFEWNTR